MKKRFYSFLLLGFGLAPLAQAQTDVFGKIAAEVDKNSQAYPRLDEACRTIGHRLTGSKNGAKAEQFTYELFKSYGFAQVDYQPFEVESWSRKSASLAIGPVGGSLAPLRTTSLAHAPVKATVQAQLADVGNGLPEDFAAKAEQVKGKIVLAQIGLLPGTAKEVKNLHRSEKTALAIRHGAAGIIMINNAPGNILLTGTASTTGKLISIPAVSITNNDGQALRQRLQTEPNLQAQIEVRNRSGLIKARNVIATLPGRELPQEKIVIGGHLDSWDLATGAMDNGLGTFAILDIARAFQALGLKPRRTIEFVMFMGEEQGLLGSRHMVRQAQASGNLEQIKYMINMDMVGNPTGVTAAQASTEAFFKAIGQQIMAVDQGYGNTFSASAGLHSDHQPFMLEGIPTMSFASNLDRRIYQCYHADCDNMDLIDREHLRASVRRVAMVLYALADAPALPAQRLDSQATKDFLIGQGLKQPLQIANDWRWGD
jgi:carboxypeptidase Q